MRTPASRAAASTFLALALLAHIPRADSAGDRLLGPFTKEEYPQAVIDRPLTLPAGMVEGEIGGRFTSRLFPRPLFGVGGTDDWDVDIALRVGVTDRIQAEAGTSFNLDHAMRQVGSFQGVPGLDVRPTLTSWQRVVPLRLSFLALDSDALDTSVTLTLPFVAAARRTVEFARGNVSVSTSNSRGRVLPFVEVAAPTRWRLSDWFWLRAGENLFAVTTDEGIALFAFDLGLGVQLHRIFAVTLDSRIASIAFDGDGHERSTTLDELGTIDLEGTVTPLRRLDVVGSLGMPDVGRGFDDYATRIAVRVRF